MTDEFITAQRAEECFLVPSAPDKRARIIAELFCMMDSREQADFFDRIAEIDQNHWNNRGTMQWIFIKDDLSPRAKRVIDEMKECTE